MSMNGESADASLKIRIEETLSNGFYYDPEPPDENQEASDGRRVMSPVAFYFWKAFKYQKSGQLSREKLAEAFLSGVFYLRISRVVLALDSERFNTMTDLHRVCLKLWREAFAGHYDELKRQCNQVLGNRNSWSEFEIACYDLITWIASSTDFTGAHRWPPKSLLCSTEQIRSAVLRIRAYFQDEMKRTAHLTRPARCSRQIATVLKGKADLYLPDLKPLWKSMIALDARKVPALPNEQDNYDELGASLSFLDETEKWCQTCAHKSQTTDQEELTGFLSSRDLANLVKQPFKRVDSYL